MARHAEILVEEPIRLFRWGEDELVVLAPCTTPLAAAALTAELRQSMSVDHLLSASSVMVNFGVVAFEPGTGPDQFAEQARHALELARGRGPGPVASLGEAGASPSGTAAEPGARKDWHSGNLLLDEQHRALQDMASEIHLLVRQPNREGEIALLAERLLVGVIDHYSEEEKILEDLAWPGWSSHSKIHSALLAKALELKLKAKIGGDFRPFVDFLVAEMVYRHEEQDDSEYLPFVSATAGRGE